jgi:hypothetical protein
MNKYTMPGQKYYDQMAKQQALANLKSGEANRYQTKANQGVATQGQLWGNLAGGATSVLGNMYVHDKGPFAPSTPQPTNYNLTYPETYESWKTPSQRNYMLD